LVAKRSSAELARIDKEPTQGVYWGPNLIHYGPLTRATHRPFVSWRGAFPTEGDLAASATCSTPVSLVAEVARAAGAAAALELYTSLAAHD